MRVTSKIAADGNRWSVEFPRVDAARCFPILNGKQTAQPDECLAELQRLERDDCGVTGVDWREKFLNCVVCQWIRLLNNWKDENCLGSEADGYERTVRQMTRRAGRGRITYARADWRCSWGDDGQPRLRCKIVTSDNGSVVEDRPWERLWAWKMAEAIKSISDDFREGGRPAIALEGECEDLLAELAEHRRECSAERFMKWTNERRFLCARHRNGYCAPICPKCRHYSAGKCVDV